MPREKAYFWPEWFAAALPWHQRRLITPRLIAKLNRANLYLWRALNIYDDFLDGDGRPERLPRGNDYYRRFLDSYYRLNLRADFYLLFNRWLKDLDNCNRREILQNKITVDNGKINYSKNLPDFSDLKNPARKSLPLGLGPLAMLSVLGYSVNSPEAQQTVNFFRAACAAKQLSDDARNWREDLTDGRITAANVLVLRAAAERHLNLDLHQKSEIADLLFATQAAGEISENIRQLCRQARKAATKIGLSPDSRLITEILVPLESAVRKARQFHRLLKISKSD
ncbi:TPA: hypothetical protein DCZ15_01845 [Candidatus Falkowbacteria bacterium]|nr:MAG: hypothetical protein UV95_C0004G0030 [Candidatus Falkowbacteria bacterium GW2011_GWF2_43_32]HBA36596.1 hypothetical protein [Candidatus Falkowbacteria bacterium]